MVRRTPKARFMGGAWVFPGGAVDAHEGEGDAAHRAAAVRELAEEAGIALGDPAALVPFARWITPPEVTIRFDTYFFLAVAPAGQEAVHDGEEIVDARWFEPARALEGSAAGELPMVFPTIKNLERIAGFASPPTRCSSGRRGREVLPVQPRVEGHGEAARIVLDDD